MRTDNYSIVHECEKFVDQLRRLRRVIISDRSEIQVAARLESAMQSIQACAHSVIAGLDHDIPYGEACEQVSNQSDQLQEQQGLLKIQPTSRTGGSNLSVGLYQIFTLLLHRNKQQAADTFILRTFANNTQAHSCESLVTSLQIEKRIAVAPLATDAFLLALSQQLQNRADPNRTFTLGIAATDPYPGERFGFDGGSRCYLPDVGHQHCIAMTDFNFKGDTRRELFRVLRETYPEADIV